MKHDDGSVRCNAVRAVFIDTGRFSIRNKMFEQNVYPDILTTAVITNVYDYDTLLLAFIVHLRSSGSEWMKNRRLVASFFPFPF